MPPIMRLPRAFARFMLPAFFLLLIPTCVVDALMMPTGEQPDEVAHIIRADGLLHFEILGHREPRIDGRIPFNAGVKANYALVDAGFAFHGGPLSQKKVTLEVQNRLGAVTWADKLTFVDVPNTAVYFPLFYVPAAMGIGVAHIAGSGPHAAIIAGRMANISIYALLGLSALLVAKRANLMIFAALTLPMTLSLAASNCPDALLVGTAALTAAALTRTGSDRSWARPLAGLGIAALIATKLPYFPLAMCTFAPFPLRQWTWKEGGRAMAEAALVALPGFIWTALNIALVSVPFVQGPAYSPGELWRGDHNDLFQATNMAAQLQVLLHNPNLILTLPLCTILHDWHGYIMTMIGILGLLDITLPETWYHLWEWALILAVLAEFLRPRGEPRAIRGGGALILGSAIVASVFAIFIAQYLSWTHVGEPLIAGVQGRYFLPLLPFAGVAIPSLGADRLNPIRWCAAAQVVATAIIGACMLPRLIMITFYLH